MALMEYNMQGVTSEKMMNPERTLKLEKLNENKDILNGDGVIDNRLFNGNNHLIAFKEPETNFWVFKYSYGIVPEPLKEKFTSFRMAFQHANQYFNKRNIKVSEVIY